MRCYSLGLGRSLSTAIAGSVVALMGSPALAQPFPWAWTTGGATPGSYWNYIVESGTDGVTNSYSSGVASYDAYVIGGTSPSVGANAGAAAPGGYHATAGAFSGAQEKWQFRVTSTDAAKDGQLVQVRLGYAGSISTGFGGTRDTGSHAQANASIWSGAEPVADAPGWSTASGGGWTISWDTDYLGPSVGFGGAPVLQVRYGQWNNLQIAAGASANSGYYLEGLPSPSAYGSASLDPTVSLVATNPNDTVEFLSVVPEPGTLSVAAGLMGAVMLRRWRK